METASPKRPRVSKKVEHGIEVVLTVVWLGGTALLLDVLHTGWWAPIVLLIVVVVVEVVFVIWNNGGLPGAKKTRKSES